MRIETGQNGEIVLKEVYNSVQLTSNAGEILHICMRDSGFEIKYDGKFYEAKQGKINKL